MVDQRIVTGARCVWWGSINTVASCGGLPCCPHCGSMLFEFPSEADWFVAVDAHEKAGNPGYRKVIEWMRGKHYNTFLEAKAQYLAEQEKK